MYCHHIWNKLINELWWLDEDLLRIDFILNAITRAKNAVGWKERKCLYKLARAGNSLRYSFFYNSQTPISEKSKICSGIYEILLNLFSNPAYIPITINISMPPSIDNWIQTFNRLRHCRIGFIRTFLSYISRQNVYTKSYNKNKDISKNNDSTLKKKFSCNLQLRTWYKTASSLKAHFDYQ